MNIQPTLNLRDGKIGTLYGGGNKGPMTIDDGLVYDLNDQDIEIETVYGGCNSADVTRGVRLTLTAGKYGTVYGGNNASGAMPSTEVILAGATVGTTTIKTDGTRTTTGGLYGGGNQAETGQTKIILKSGTASNVYGGGDAATVTRSVDIIANGNAVVTNLFCGNNHADMDIHPTVDLQEGTVWTFYGGGNAGAMTRLAGLEYTFDDPDMHYTYIIGGCNAADVTSEEGVTLNLSGVTADTAIYGGCNEKGNVAKTTINILGDVSPSSGSHAYTSVFGGGRGEQTTVGVTNIYAKNGTVKGKLYGGSGFGRVNESHVTVREQEENTGSSRIVITGDVFGGGYGESSVVGSTDVLINTKLRIHDPNMSGDTNDFDLSVTEELANTTTNDEAPSGETSVKVDWLNGKDPVSRICGNVYGGGDMGQVGKGTIYSGTNTAAISEDGFTHVRLQSGYVEGDIFGGGSGKPASGTSYSLQMGAVFGCCQTDVTGGYVGGNVYGGGYQSRIYANHASKKRLPLYYDSAQENGIPEENAEHLNVLAAQVNIIEQEDFAPIIIGSSVFGGGAKGEGNSTNPNVYTVVGDVEVNIIGRHGRDSRRSTAIYFGQSGGDLGGGLYGDGNLCLVSGEKTVNIRCFNAGYQEGGGGAGTKLKTFYSLQRADTVNVQHSRFVLRGAVDLVDENADSTLFSINRVEQLNMRQNSTIKLNEIVNLLGGLWSDEHAETRYINRGNNGQNGYTDRGGVGLDYSYPDAGDKTPDDITMNGMYSNDDGSIRRVIGNNNRIIHYRNEYMKFIHGDSYPGEPYNDNEPHAKFATLNSFNEICVANGKYLEIKKSNTEYGDVKGVFILSLLHANPGAGGGFVYASIGDADRLNSGSTGAFVCVTKDTSKADADVEEQPYMIISHNVGGYRKTGDTGDYSYYYWYIKGNKYIYDMKLTGYIGTVDTDFANTVVLTEMDDRHYVLKNIVGKEPIKNPTGHDIFNSEQLVDHWGDGLADSDKYALELKAVVKSKNNTDPKEESIGFLSYYGGKWQIKKPDDTYVSGKGEQTDQNECKSNDLITVDSNTTNLELEVVLHKGRAVQTEIRDVPVSLEFDVYKTTTDGGYDTDNDASAIKIDLSTSIVRLVPTQDVYLSPGRLYAGVPSDLNIRITGDSAFTVQYITKFMPSAFNTSTIHMTESLTTAVEETYLLDNETGVGFTLNKDDELIHVTNGAIDEYEITKGENGEYTVTYPKTADSEQQTSYQLTVCKGKTDGITFPKGTMITMIAQIDSYTPTYWYYYCNGDESELKLDSFTKMNCTTDPTAKFSFENASNGNVSYTASQRITENLSFIFDFSKTNLSEPEATGEATGLNGNLRLLHTFQSGESSIDIMDAVSSSTEKGSDTIKYERNYPKVSKTFTIVKGTGDLELSNFEAKKEVYSTDTFDVTFSVTEDTALGENTHYGEREYSVLLERLDDTGTAIAFPAGTTFRYGDELLTLVNNNKAVFVPIKTTGDHTVTMETSMVEFSAGNHKLKATVYSSQDANYYNELNTGRSQTCTFTVAESPTFALSVKQAENKHLYSAGEAMELTLATQSNITDDPGPISVKLFKYNRNGKNYTPGSLTDVLTGAQETCVAAPAVAWTAAISESAALGTYRLEFRYHDRTEYWDFIIKKPE